MRPLHALLNAMRKRRSAEADLIADDPGLRRLIDAARAPATARELAGEKSAVSAFTADRKRAARAARPRRPVRLRAVLVPVTTGLALLLFTGTAVAARTGNLPQAAQQHAHRLFSALGVPAPRTGTPSPRVSPSPAPASGPASHRPGSRPSIDAAAFTRCEAWRGAAPLTGHDRRQLIAAAGGEQAIARYCDKLRQSTPPSPPSAPPPVPPVGEKPKPPSPGTTPTPPGPSPTGTPPTGPEPAPSRTPAQQGGFPGDVSPSSADVTVPAGKSPGAAEGSSRPVTGSGP
jgi:hypothetical protein